MNQGHEAQFLFLSQILRRRVRDSEGKVVGYVRDLSALSGEIYPVTHAFLIVRGLMRKTRLSVPWEDVDLSSVTMSADILLKTPTQTLSPPLAPLENEFFLRKELLDNQVVDTRGRKVVRVNDVHLMLNNGEMRVVHVDVGMRGIFRSMGWEMAVDALVRFFSPHARYLTREHFVSWKYVQPMSVGSLKRGLLKLNVTMKKLSRLHPADLAEIMQDLDRHQRSALFQSFDIETAAEALSESHPRMQRHLLETVGTEKAADLLEEMPPDKAADLLADLPKEEASELLTKMEKDEAREISELLGYEEDTAGGLMTTDFMSSQRDIYIRDLMERMRGILPKTETAYYIYVVEQNGHLTGVVTLRDLLLSNPDQKVMEIVAENPVTIHPEENIRTMIDLFTKYKLRALPVVDAEGKIKGIVTVDDVLTHVFGQNRKS